MQTTKWYLVQVQLVFNSSSMCMFNLWWEYEIQCNSPKSVIMICWTKEDNRCHSLILSYWTIHCLKWSSVSWSVFQLTAWWALRTFTVSAKCTNESAVFEICILFWWSKIELVQIILYHYTQHTYARIIFKKKTTFRDCKWLKRMH